MEQTKHLLVVDADSILYTACYRNQEPFELELAYMDFVTKVNNVKREYFNLIKEDYIVGYYRGKPKYDVPLDFKVIFSPKKTFRNELTDTYKSNRKPTTIEGISILKELVKERLDIRVEEWENIEADDVVVWYAYNVENTVIGCIDKDIIDHSPVKCFNYKKWEWTEPIDEETIEDNYWIQALTGDSTDGIKGAVGIGPKKAEAIVLNPLSFDGWETYKTNFDSDEEAILSMRLVRMDQLNKDKELELWEP